MTPDPSVPRPIAVSVGEPAGIGPEIAARAWDALGQDLPFFVIGDPAHLAGFGMPVIEVDTPADVANACRHGLPVLPHQHVLLCLCCRINGIFSFSQEKSSHPTL